MRDYVRNAPAKRKPNSRTPTGRRPTKGGSSETSLPIIKIAIAAVILLGFAFFLYHISGSSGTTDEVTTGKNSPENQPIPIEQQRPGKEPFDYMDILQNKEVPVTLPDGEVIADPSKDPQLLAHQQKLQEQLQLQQERAKQLAMQQNGQLSTSVVDNTQDDPNIQTPKSINTGVTNTASTTSTVTNTTATEAKPKPVDPRKPRSFAEIIASENTKQKVTSSSELQTRADKERNEALAAFGKPQAFGGSKSNTPAPVSDITEPTSSKRYMMQCGAFRTNEQANTLKSRISSQGQSAQIRQVNSSTGTWHRVILGPYASKASAESSLSRLRSAGTVSACTIFAQ